jgi:putative transposase
VGIFHNDAATARLTAAVLIETHDEWQVIERRYFSEGSMAAINAAADPSTITEERPALLGPDQPR